MLWCSHVLKHATFFRLHFLWHAIFQNFSRCCLLQADYALHIACNFSGDSQTVACIRHAISLWRYGWSSQYCPVASSGCIQYRMQFYFFTSNIARHSYGLHPISHAILFFCQQHHKALIRLASYTACNFIFYQQHIYAFIWISYDIACNFYFLASNMTWYKFRLLGILQFIFTSTLHGALTDTHHM